MPINIAAAKEPLYPVLPKFSLTCAYLAYSSIIYAQSQGAIHVSFTAMATGVAEQEVLDAAGRF